MTVDEFKQSQEERTKTFIFEEIQERATAAARLVNKFDLDGITIEPGVEKDGKISVHGVRRLAEICNVPIIKDSVQYDSGTVADYERITINGIVFSELINITIGSSNNVR